MPAMPTIEVKLLDTPVRAQSFDPFPQPAGGECVFLGRTRTESHPDHGSLTRLSYEAYRPMAERTLRAASCPVLTVKSDEK